MQRFGADSEPCSTGVRRRVGVLGSLGIYPADRLSGASRRVMAHLAVRGPQQLRTVVSSELWPDVPENRARANLRRALWQLPVGWVAVDGPDLVIDASVDLTDATLAAERAVAGEAIGRDEVELLARDLLPGWYDDWIVGAQQRFHLMRVQALEATCRTTARCGDLTLATHAGLAAVTAEPLRESAVQALIEAHLQEGNRFEAVRRYRAYEQLLGTELGIVPSAPLADLVASVVGTH
jgi:DNA-binding SARP family transcriptional activator